MSDTERERLHPAPDDKVAQIGDWIRDPQAQRQAFRATLKSRQTLKAPSDVPGSWRDLDSLFTWRTLGQDAILQPPKPSITPSSRLLQRASEHDVEPEAGG